MSENYIINEDTGSPDFFTIDGSAIDTGTQPKVTGGAVQGLGVGTGNDTDLLDNIQLGGTCSPTDYLPLITDDTQYAYQINTGIDFPNSHYDGNEVFYKGNLDNVTGGMEIGPECRHEFSGTDLAPGITTAIRNGYWNPVTATWSTDPSGVSTTFAADDDLTNPGFAYRFGGAAAATGTY